MLKRLSFTVSVSLALAGSLLAQKDAAATQALERAAQAAGFLPGELRSLSATGTFTALNSLQQIPLALTVKVLAPDRVRWELSGPDGTTTTAVTGTSGWTRSGGATRGLSVSESVARGIALFPLLGLDDWISSPGTGLAPPVADDSGGAGPALSRVTVTRRAVGQIGDDTGEALETIARLDLLVERGSGRAAAVELIDRSGRDWRLGRLVRITFGDVVAIRGFMLPRTLVGFGDGAPAWQIHFDSIQVNPPLAEGDFQP